MKKNVYLLLLIIIVGGILAYIYTNSIGTINEQNIKEIKIQSINASSNSNYVLSDSNKTVLFESLSSKSENKIVSDKHLDIAYEYNFVLSNTWGVSTEYRVLYLKEDMTVWVQRQKDSNLYKIDNPEFFYIYEGFSNIYNDRLSPAVHIIAGDEEVQFQALEKSWSYLRFDGQWMSEEYDVTGESELDKQNNVPVGIQRLVPITSVTEPIQVQVDKVPDRSWLIIKNRALDSVVYEGEADVMQLPYPNGNGQFDYELAIEWNNQKNQYQGKYTVNFSVILDLDDVLTFSKQQLIQGDILEISVKYAGELDDIYLEQSIFKQFRWYVQDDILRGYIPTNYSTKPGVHEIKYGNRKKGIEYIEKIEVVPHDYRIQYMYIDKSIAQETRNEAAYAEFAKYFNPVRKQSESTRYYTDSFVIPAKGRLTTEFGQTRYVNDEPTSSRHSGLDIAAPTGTEILATNRGKVVLAMPLILTGNTIVIDHGEGLFSVYFHMHENLVTVGQIIDRGQRIATIGTTGFSTGPHLHFTMSYYDMNIEPGFFLVGQPITLTNYQEYLQ